MKITRALLILLVCIPSVGYSESYRFLEPAKEVQPVEADLLFGLNVPLQGFNGLAPTFYKYAPNVNWSGSIELRYNFKKSPWDTGLIFDVGLLKLYNKESNQSIHGGLFFLGVEGDYNFRQGWKVNPYAGIGIGPAFSGMDDSPFDGKCYFAFRPRIGVELWYYFRVETGFYIMRKGLNHFYLGVGINLGGRPKK